jgi:hypothetical protein
MKCGSVVVLELQNENFKKVRIRLLAIIVNEIGFFVKVRNFDEILFA